MRINDINVGRTPDAEYDAFILKIADGVEQILKGDPQSMILVSEELRNRALKDYEDALKVIYNEH